MSDAISAVVITRDEERNLPYALRSLAPWVSDLVVVDMHSEDRTREIAENHGARVFLHEPTGFVEPARAFAIKQCREDWVVLLDADELVPEPLSRRLREIARSGSADAVTISRINYLLGERLGHTGWGPHQDRQLRFFRRGAVSFSNRIHVKPSLEPGARILDLPPHASEALIHFNYVDLAHFLEKLNRYTSIEAVQAHERGGAIGPVGAVTGGLRKFVAKYFRLGGFRDGWRGFLLSSFQAFYVFAVGAKRMELERAGTHEAIDEVYRDEAEKFLAAYDSDPRS